MISQATSIRFEEMHFKRIDNIKDLLGRLPQRSEMFMIWSRQSFNSWSMILYCIKHLGTIDHLTLSTYSINSRIITALRKHVGNGNISRLTLLVSDSIRQRLPKICEELNSLKNDHGVEIIYAWNHSKIALVKCGDNFLTIEGSGNLSENAMYEQYIILNDEEAYTFRQKCITSSEIRR